jgi:hypothetical protein
MRNSQWAAHFLATVPKMVAMTMMHSVSRPNSTTVHRGMPLSSEIAFVAAVPLLPTIGTGLRASGTELLAVPVSVCCEEVT